MLKYQINRKTARTDLEPLAISTVESTNIPFEGTNRMLLTCYLAERDVVHENDTIVAIYHIETNDQYRSSQSNIVEEYNVVGVNDVDLSFNIVYDKYFSAEAEFARKETTIRYDKQGNYTEVEYLTIYFSSYHHLRGGDLDETKCNVYLSDSVSTAVEQLIPMKGEIIDNYTIRFGLEDKGNQEAYDRIFSIDLFKAQNYAPLIHFRLLQDNFMFETTGENVLRHTKLYVQKNVATLSIPLTNTFSTELYSSINVNGFVNKQVEYALNSGTENEKDIYRPVLKIGQQLKRINKIKFNFHFRQRDGNQWITNNLRFWNGVTVEQDFNDKYVYKLDDKFFSYTNESCQSDLLGLLSFSNEDVKYRKNVLKKSFIRLLFYDSMDQFNQHLLSYATIFVDTGDLLNKYMRNIAGDKLGLGYLSYKDEDNGSPTIVTNLKGIRVDRELNIDHSYGNDDILESCRLSSQIVVMDKFVSGGSSEGFYLYLWKDNVGDGIPNDLYMRVEYNHAKFGRTIPFMMPYYTDEEGEISGVKSFDEIVKDVFNTKTGENLGYTMEEYRDYSYIHFHYEREDNEGYVYYLDEGYNIDTNDNSLTLNLYEANVR